MKKNLSNQVLPLAGLLHATSLVRQLAHEGRIDEQQFACAMAPVLELDPESLDDVYGGPECRHSILTVLKAQLANDRTGRDLDATRYSATLMHLERKLTARDDLMNTLREGLEQARRQCEHFSLTHENVIARLADLYANTVSQLQPKVMVQGDPRYLEDPGTANRVRALLLAGMRSVVLWRQCGGSRLKLILGRNRLMRAANAIDPDPSTAPDSETR